MLNVALLQNALREKARERREESERTGDVRFEWSANLLERFADEVGSILKIGEMDQLDQAYAADADGSFRAKVDAVISDVGFSRQYAHAGFLVQDILSGEPRRPTSKKAEELFAKMFGQTKT